MGNVDAYFLDEVTITGRGALEKAGTYDEGGETQKVRARVVEKSGVRKTIDGAEWMYTHKIYFRSSVTIALQDEITYKGINYEARDIEKA